MSDDAKLDFIIRKFEKELKEYGYERSNAVFYEYNSVVKSFRLFYKKKKGVE